jgi:hypothetical protein
VTDFTLTKLGEIVKNMTGKEAAVLAMKYREKSNRATSDFDREIDIIMRSIRQNQADDFNYYWHIYRNLTIVAQRVNINLAELLIRIERLSKFYLLIYLIPVLRNASQLLKQQSPNNISDINQNTDSLYQYQENAFLAGQLIDLIPAVPAANHAVILSDYFKPAFTKVISDINCFIETLNGYKQVIITIENDYLDGHDIISSHPVWRHIQNTLTLIYEKHTSCLSDLTKFILTDTNVNMSQINNYRNLQIIIDGCNDEKWINQEMENITNISKSN